MIKNLLHGYVSERFKNEPDYRQGHIRIVNPLPGTEILGLHVPDMKKVAKDLSRSESAMELIAGFRASRNLCHEEKMVWGLMLDCMKMPRDERLGEFSSFVPAIDNWAVCDCVCGAAKWASAKALRKSPSDRKRIWDWLSAWLASDREFEVRFAVIMYMSYFLDEEWLPRIFGMLDTLDFGKVSSEYSFCKKEASNGMPTAPGPAPYYVRMGVAWLLATALSKFPDATRAYVHESRLPEDVLKLYARKARESFRTRNMPAF